MVDYLQTYYPEDFNDFVESSEFIALIDMIAYLGQNLAFRGDLNARENFIDTAERRDSVIKLAKLISYSPKRNQTSSGFLKLESIRTTETLSDSDNTNLTNLNINWNDSTNPNWYEQFVIVMNAALNNNVQIGKPSHKQTIGGIVHDEYPINIPGNILPVFPYVSEVEGSPLRFEVVSPTSVGSTYIYESSPKYGSGLNILYRNDSRGNGSVNTGFFFYFKQGELRNTPFDINESIPNNLININVDNINNTDLWLYELNNQGNIKEEWSRVISVVGTNVIYNNRETKKIYQVASRNNDQVDLVFGDGTFASIPNGIFTTFYRVSSGTSYKITPDEMRGITITIPYISKTNRPETLTISASLKYTVANALAAETIDEIRSRAPQQYYTQNRMVTGEDYNTFPYANFSSISKIKAVNRSSAGSSRFLDVIDTTGRYSSTNIFSDDGSLYKEFFTDNTTKFTWTTSVDINKVIQNVIMPKLRSKDLLHFYYDKFPRYSLTDMKWNRATVGSSSSTGYFTNVSGNTLKLIGSGVTGTAAYAGINSIIVFGAGTNKYFDRQNNIRNIPADGKIPPGGQQYIKAAVTNVTAGATRGLQPNGNGIVSLSENVPTNAVAQTVIPAFSNSFSVDFVRNLILRIQNYLEFGIRFDSTTQSWVVIDRQNVNNTSEFDLTTAGTNNDSSWILNFRVNNNTYTVDIRGMRYVFYSSRNTKFYFDESTKIFDPITGLTINDSIKILSSNLNPQRTSPLPDNVSWYVYKNVLSGDGFVDNSRVYLTYSDHNDDGVPDDPDIFELVVGNSTNLIFYHIESSSNNFNYVTVVDQGMVETQYSTTTAIRTDINNFVIGQIFYLGNNVFYKITESNGIRNLSNVSSEYFARNGRQDLLFQYRHNAPGNRRIDPSPANIIDLYVLTKEYESSYRTWAINNIGSEPASPTAEELKLQFSSLEDYKCVSDSLVYNSAKFKPLFGSKASSNLRATFKVIKNSGLSLSDSEIRSQVLRHINLFFAEGNWDFGDTFYFTELSTYIQQAMVPNISSIIIVPENAEQSYGSLQQISSQPDEILISVATVDNIEIISSITASQLTNSTAVNNIIN
jgi:hypothetical protein